MPERATTADIKEDLQEIRADMERLRDDLAEVVRSMVAMSKSSAEGAKDRTVDELEFRLGQMRGAYESTRRRARGAAESMHESLEERPVTSMMIAFGVGVAIGKLLSGK